MIYDFISFTYVFVAVAKHCYCTHCILRGSPKNIILVCHLGTAILINIGTITMISKWICGQDKPRWDKHMDLTTLRVRSQKHDIC